MAMGYKNGLINQSTMVITKTERNMGKESSFGLMVQCMKEILRPTKSKEKGYLFGQTKNHMKENGMIIKCMEKENSYGQMVVNMRVSLLKI